MRHFAIDPGRTRAILALAVLAALAALVLPKTRSFRVDEALSVSADTGAKQFPNGFSTSPDFFPIGVWMQAPERAAQYKSLGINTYLHTSGEVTEASLEALSRAGLFLVTEQSAVTLSSRSAQVIKGWAQQDEPDNAQMDTVKTGTPPCVPANSVVEHYHVIRKNDPSRPVFLNYGPGAGDREWIGRGTCTGDWDYYRTASTGADIVSFDIYPITSPHNTNNGKLEMIQMGVANLVRSVDRVKPVWFIVGTTHVEHPTRRPTVQEVKSQVWIAITAGARGIAYFVHEWQPSFSEPGVFRYPEIVEAIKDTNNLITNLAPILNSPSLPDLVTIDPKLPLAMMIKKGRGGLFVFMANLSREPTPVTWKTKGNGETSAIDLLSGQSIIMTNGVVTDILQGYGVRVYRISP